MAEYLTGPNAKKREVSAHFAYSSKHDNFVCLVPTNRIAFHAGESSWRGWDSCNQFSIGIELPGPINERISDDVLEKLYCITGKIIATHGSITHVCGHRHISPGRRFDPNEFFDFKEFANITGLKFEEE